MNILQPGYLNTNYPTTIVYASNSNTTVIYILVVYRQPSANRAVFNAFINELQQSIGAIKRNGKNSDSIIITRDFNVHCNEWFRTNQPTALGDQLKEMLDGSGMQQVINHHSYQRGDSYRSLLDLVITNPP